MAVLYDSGSKAHATRSRSCPEQTPARRVAGTDSALHFKAGRYGRKAISNKPRTVIPRNAGPRQFVYKEILNRTTLNAECAKQS